MAEVIERTTGITDAEIELPELTPGHVRQLIFDSYRFSQGIAGLQRRFFAKAVALHEGALTTDMVHGVREEIDQLAERFATDSGFHHPATPHGVSDDVGRMFSRFEEIIAGTLDPEVPAGHRLPPLSEHILVRDARYLLGKRRPEEPESVGRPRRGVRHTGPRGDRWLSHFFHYGALRKPTGTPEYNQVFADAVTDCLEVCQVTGHPGWHDEYFKNLSGVAGVYFHFHPDERQDLPDELAAHIDWQRGEAAVERTLQLDRIT